MARTRDCLRRFVNVRFINWSNTNWKNIKKKIQSTEQYIFWERYCKPFDKMLNYLDKAPHINKIKFKNCDIDDRKVFFETETVLNLESDDFTICYYECFEGDKTGNINKIKIQRSLLYTINGSKEIEVKFSQKALNKIIKEIYIMQNNHAINQ